MNLVTGATGLTGAHVALYLVRSGKPVRAFRRSSSSLDLISNVFRLYSPSPEEDLSGIEWVEGDIADTVSLESALEGVTDVYHSAALVSFRQSDRKKLMEVNVKGTANLVNACLFTGIRKLCHVSSIAALGRADRAGQVINEKTSWKTSRDNSNYAISKYGAEREVWRGYAEGLNAVIVNPSVILGLAGPSMGSARLFSVVWEGLKFYPPGSNGFVDVRDVAGIMVRLMESQISGERYILNAGNCNYKDLFHLIAKHLGRPAPHIGVKKWMAGTTWRLEALRSALAGSKPILTRETARTAMHDYAYANEKIREALNYEFIAIEESIAHHSRLFMGFNS